MANITERIPLQIVDGRLVLMVVIECETLRVRKHFTKFVIDTGSPDSYLSDKDVTKLQIAMKSRPVEDIVSLGGSKYKQTSLPKFKMYLLKEDKNKNDHIELSVNLSALKTTKIKEEKKQNAQLIPSILGTDFLKEQRLSLHVILTEDMAYLQKE